MSLHKPKHFLRIKLFLMGILCAIGAIIKPNDMFQMYEDADTMKQLKDRADRLNRLRSQTLRGGKTHQVGVVLK